MNATGSAVPYAFAADRFDHAMAELGHHTEADRAEAAGIDEMTMDRLRRGRFTVLPNKAMQVAHAAGLTVEDLFIPKAGIKTIEERVCEILADAPPITAEQRESAVRILARVPGRRLANTWGGRD